MVRVVRFGWMGAGALFLSLVAGGCSSKPAGPEPTGTTAQAIQNGTDDPGDKFAVGVCIGQKGYCSYICSGALILPNLVVTARHCTSQLPSEQVDCSTNPSFTGDYGANNIFITTNEFMLAQDNGGVVPAYHSVKQVIRPKDAHICGNDISFLILSDNVTDATPIIPGVQYPMGDARYSQRFEAIGFGATDASASGPGAGSRRIKKNISVLCIPGDDVLDCPPDASPAVQPSEFVGNGGTCGGDSGSSAYDTISYNAGKPVSYGVLSRGGQNGTTCSDSIYTRLDAWRDLTIQAAQTASNNWTLYPKPNPDWTVYVPPPPKDGGTTDGGSSGQPAQGTGAVGDSCTVPSDCAGGQCIDPGDGNLICSQSCDDSNPCPDGYDCSADSALCMPKPAAPATVKSDDTSKSGGCSAAPGSSGSGAGIAFAGLALVLAAARRRRAKA